MKRFLLFVLTLCGLSTLAFAQDTTTEPETYVAAITTESGGAYYATLQSAVDAATTVGTADVPVTITLLSDIVLDKTITIKDKYLVIDGAKTDGGSYTISGTGIGKVGGKIVGFFIEGGDVTIQNVILTDYDSDLTCNAGSVICVDAGEPTFVAKNVTVNKFARDAFTLFSGTFTIDGCAIDCAPDPARGTCLLKGFQVGNTGRLSPVSGVIKGTIITKAASTYTNWQASAIEVYANSDVLIEGCEITASPYGVYIDNYYAGMSGFVAAPSTVTLRDTTIKDSFYTVYVATRTDQTNTVTVNVESGTYDGYVGLVFDSTAGKWSTDYEHNNVLVSGGTFAQSPSGHLPEHAVVHKNTSTGTWSVILGAPIEEAVCSIMWDEEVVYFQTLEAALAAADVGDTITLLADVDTEYTPTYTGEGAVHIDVNGHTLKCGWFSESSEKIRFTTGCAWTPYTKRYNKEYPTVLRVYSTFDAAYHSKGNGKVENWENASLSLFTLFDDVVLTEDITLKSSHTTSYILIPSGYDVTLDLAGHTITQENCLGQSYGVLNVSGKLTVVDSSEDNSGLIVAGASTGNHGAGAAVNADGGGVAILKAGTYTSSVTTTSMCFGVLTAQGEGSKIIFDGATIKTALYAATRAITHGEIELLSGTIDMRDATGYYIGWVYNVVNSDGVDLGAGKVTVGRMPENGEYSEELKILGTGGIVVGEMGDAVINVENFSVWPSSADVTLTVNAPNTYIYKGWIGESANLPITVAEDLVVVGDWVVPAGVATNFGIALDGGIPVTYPTLAAALNAVTAEANVVTLLTDTTEEVAIKTAIETYTVDGDGKTVTLTHPWTLGSATTLKNISVAQDEGFEGTSLVVPAGTALTAEGDNTIAAGLPGTTLKIDGSGTLTVSGELATTTLTIGTTTTVSANAITATTLIFAGELPTATGGDDTEQHYLLPTKTETLTASVAWSRTGETLRPVTATASMAGTEITLPLPPGPVTIEAKLDEAGEVTGEYVPVLDIAAGLETLPENGVLTTPEDADHPELSNQPVAAVTVDETTGKKTFEVTDAALVIAGADVSIKTQTGMIDEAGTVGIEVTEAQHETMELLNAKYEVDETEGIKLSYVYDFGIHGMEIEQVTDAQGQAHIALKRIEIGLHEGEGEAVVARTITLEHATLEVHCDRIDGTSPCILSIEQPTFVDGLLVWPPLGAEETIYIDALLTGATGVSKVSIKLVPYVAP